MTEPGPITREPAGTTGLAVRAETVLLRLAGRKGIVRFSEYHNDLGWQRSTLLTNDVLRQLASCSDEGLFAQRHFGRKYLADFRALYPQDTARPIVTIAPERPEDV